MFQYPYFKKFFDPEWATRHSAYQAQLVARKLIDNFADTNRRSDVLVQLAITLLRKAKAPEFQFYELDFGTNQYLLTRGFYTEVATELAMKLLEIGRGLPYAHLKLDKWRQHAGDRELSEIKEAIEMSSEDCVAVERYLLNNLRLGYCQDCGELEFRSRLSRTTSYERVCSDCIENHYSWSDYLDLYINSDSIVWATADDGSDVLLDGDNIPPSFTYDEDLDRYVHEDYCTSVIAGYHSSKNCVCPQEDEWTRARNGLYLGVELEVEASENRDKIANRINDVVNSNKRWVFFERDGSLSSGFEMISQPVSLPRHRDIWSFLKDRSLIRGLKSHNTTTCGLHVHVSRNVLTPLQIAKIVTFVNDPDNEHLITAIARRYGVSGYARIKDKSKIGDNAHSDDRYEAVNLTNRTTIEFRIFKGSLKYESVVSAIEFCNAMVEFTKPCSEASITNLKTDSFLKFINTKLQKETSFLRPYIANRLEV